MLTWILYLVIKIHHSIDIPIYSLLLYYRDIFEFTHKRIKIYPILIDIFIANMIVKLIKYYVVS